MFKFTEQVTAKLIASGWFKGRKANIHEYLLIIESEGYEISTAVKSFLYEFGGLNIELELINGEQDYMHFDPIKAVSSFYSDWISDNYSKRIKNNTLSVIGQAFTNHLTLMMNSNGEVYGGYDENLYFIAASGPEAIQTILSNNKFEEIT
jgi:hypothetical protein